MDWLLGNIKPAFAILLYLLAEDVADEKLLFMMTDLFQLHTTRELKK